MKARYLLAIVLWVVSVGYDALPAQWSTFAPMPTARWGAGCVAEGGKLYVISGNSATNNEVYNPANNTWSVLAPIPIFTAYPQMAAYNGKIYVLGGANGSTWLNNNQIYDIGTNSWSVGAPMASGRMGGTSVVYNGKIYVTTGWNSALMTSLEIYDINTNTWSTGAAAPTARYQTRGGLINGRMYVTGGYTSTWVGTHEEYNIATNTWTTRAAMPAARYIHAGGSDGSELFMAAGYAGGASNSFQSYNPLTNAWTVRPNAPTARYRVDGAVVNGCFYVAGGFNGAVTVATLEGFCGLVVLPSADIRLTATKVNDAVRLDWSMSNPVDAEAIQIERKTGQTDFERIAGLPTNGATTFTDLDAPGSWLCYRVAWQDANGEVHHSNMETIEMAATPQPDFYFFAADARLMFVPNAPFPMNQGIATLWDLNGRQLRSEKVAGQVDWDLSLLPQGTYIFRWADGKGGLTRKVVR